MPAKIPFQIEKYYTDALSEEELAEALAKEFTEIYGCNIEVKPKDEGIVGSAPEVNAKEIVMALIKMEKELHRYTPKAISTANISSIVLAHQWMVYTGQSVGGLVTHPPGGLVRKVYLDLDQLNHGKFFELSLHHEFWHCLIQEIGYNNSFLRKYEAIAQSGYISGYARSGGMDEDLAENWANYMVSGNAIASKLELQLKDYGWILRDINDKSSIK